MLPLNCVGPAKRQTVGSDLLTADFNVVDAVCSASGVLFLFALNNRGIRAPNSVFARYETDYRTKNTSPEAV